MHIPVLKEEVLNFLNPKSNENFIDCTAGEGGHSEAILRKNSPGGRVLAIEWDEELYKRLKKKETERFVPVNDSYTNIKDIAQEKNFFPVSGILFDLGFCSFHIDESRRGFSFLRDELLDMRYNKSNPLTAYEIVNKYKEKDLLHILKKWGEEDYASVIARKIVLKRKENVIRTTADLSKVVEDAIPESVKAVKKINCATKTFQALRIAVNGEMLGFSFALSESLEIIEKGGRIAVICFHGGEEKIVNGFLRQRKERVHIFRPILPKKEEVKNNIRARSAKLYMAIKK